jgi:hypothetical protein
MGGKIQTMVKEDMMNNMTLQHITTRDDGTQDTVVECTCPMCNEELEYRFNNEYAQEMGYDAGLMATEAWEGEICGIDH